MTHIDVVVVSFNSHEHLRACLRPLVEFEGVHVTVVDNASADDSLDAVADLPVTCVRLPENRGFAHGCNVGWHLGGAPFVLLINPDALIDEQSLRSLMRRLVEDPRVGAIGPRIVQSDGSLALSQRRFRRLRSTYAQALFLHRVFPKASWANEVVRDPQQYEQPGSPEWISGACVLVRRSLLEQLNGLDDSFFLYCEDEDLCRRIRQLGFEIRYEPHAVAIHEGGASAPRAALLPVLAESRLRYMRKHERPLIAGLDRIGLGLEALTHAILCQGGGPARRGHVRALRLVALSLTSGEEPGRSGIFLRK